MGRFKKGQKQKNQDLWQLAGGRDALVKTLIKHNLSDKVTREQWLAITLDIFKTSGTKYSTWLKVIWTEDRRGQRCLKSNYIEL